MKKEAQPNQSEVAAASALAGGGGDALMDAAQ